MRSNVMAKVLVFRIDYDGCLSSSEIVPRVDVKRDTLYAACLRPEQHPVVEQNPVLVDHILNSIRSHPDCETVIIQIGTNRQTKFIDIYNGGEKGNGSCLSAYERLYQEIQGRLAMQYGSRPPVVMLDKTLLGDLEYQGQVGGTVYMETQASMSGMLIWNRDQATEREAFAFATVSDGNKLLLNYFFNQRLADKFRGQTILVEFIDDNEELLRESTSFFQQHPALCPDSITVQAVKYTRNIISIGGSYIGTGSLQLDYKSRVGQTLESWKPMIDEASQALVVIEPAEGYKRAVKTLQQFAVLSTPTVTDTAAGSLYPLPPQQPDGQGYQYPVVLQPAQLAAAGATQAQPQMLQQPGGQWQQYSGVWPVQQQAIASLVRPQQLQPQTAAPFSLQPPPPRADFGAHLVQPSAPLLSEEDTDQERTDQKHADPAIEAENQKVLKGWAERIHPGFVKLGVLSDHQPQVCHETGILIWNICMLCSLHVSGSYNNGFAIQETLGQYRHRLAIIGYNLQKFIFENHRIDTVLLQEVSADEQDLKILLVGINQARKEYGREPLKQDELPKVEAKKGLLTLSFDNERDLRYHPEKGEIGIRGAAKHRVNYILDSQNNRLIVNVHADYECGIKNILSELGDLLLSKPHYQHLQVILAGDFNRNLFTLDMVEKSVGTEPSLDHITHQEVFIGGQKWIAYSAGPGNITQVENEAFLQQADGALAIRAPEMRLTFADGLNTLTFRTSRFASLEDIIEALNQSLCVTAPVSVAAAAAPHSIFHCEATGGAAAAGAATNTMDEFRQLGYQLNDLIGNIEAEKYKCASFFAASPLTIYQRGVSKTVEGLLPMVYSLFLLVRELRHAGELKQKQDAFEKIMEWCRETPRLKSEVVGGLQTKVFEACEEFKKGRSNESTASAAPRI